MTMLSLVGWLALSPALAQSSGPTDTTAALEQAYQKEYAYLKAEKRALEQRRQELRTDAAARIRKGEASISGLEARLLALESQGNAVEQRISQVEDASLAAEEARALIDTLVSQAGEALQLEVADGLPDSARLTQVFTAAAARLTEGRSVRTVQGPFFLPDGTQVQGQIVYVGEVAAYGVSERGAGALLPIGEGRLQLRLSGGGEAEAAALAGGQAPTTLGTFLFESLDKPITERQEATLADVMEDGGTVGWVIVVLGAVALVMAGIRATILSLAGRGYPLVEPAAARVRDGDLAGALALVSGSRTPIARVLARVLRAAAEKGREREMLQDVASEALLFELPALERFGALIIVVAAVAPLLGLLGTVTGMIATFEVITEFGTGDPKMLSGGISAALITTQQGLVVAIPTVLLGNILKGRADAVVARIERSALHVVNLLAGEDEQDTPDIRIASK